MKRFVYLKIKIILFILINYLFIVEMKALDTSSLKKSAPIYQNPFDLASGGASMTRATQEGVLFSNPSLPAFGEGIFRWTFLRSTVSIGADTISFAKDAVTAAGNFNATQLQNLLTDVVKKPVHFGLDNAAGVITSNFGMAGFAVAKIDVEGREFGTLGLPEIHLRNNGFAGIATSMSTQFADILAIGVGPKYIYNAEINTDLGVNDILNVSQAQDKVLNSIKRGSGISTDIGVTLQKRSKYFDVRLAGVVSDLGNTTFTGGVPPWLQTYNAGMGFALHDETNALHCAIDYRDITDVYGEDLPKKVYMGCKLLITRIFGVGFGYLQGWPSYGVVLNLFLMRIEAGSYTKDAGNYQAGILGRQVYFVSLGFEL
ncbi:hypothetical protein [Fluviispira multicolorata]|uniref:DUF5723 domain-containing protein n=1 Tax=Fluviispira multicolorata TaxID=2654512 RepID=A0A833JA46_9BACT|nr:hypothetical protein [Fluviispira multicolorata]KAB8027379.1 hypothetical protein GCL57_14370 [Fluviispira multicolorata]